MDTYTGPDPEVFEATNQSKEDEQLLVKFYLEPMQDHTKSAELGRAVFKDVEFVDIRVPGSRDSVARPARPADIARFPRHYDAFKKRIDMPVEGTPLIEWPLLSRSGVEELAFLGIKTVEQLASVADVHTSSVRGLASFKRQAQEWLEDAKDDAHVTKLTARLEDAERQLELRDRQLQELSSRLASLEEAASPAASPPAAEAALQSSLDAPPGDEETPRPVRRPRKRRDKAAAEA